MQLLAKGEGKKRRKKKALHRGRLEHKEREIKQNWGNQTARILHWLAGDPTAMLLVDQPLSHHDLRLPLSPSLFLLSSFLCETDRSPLCLTSISILSWPGPHPPSPRRAKQPGGGGGEVRGREGANGKGKPHEPSVTAPVLFLACQRDLGCVCFNEVCFFSFQPLQRS